MIFQPCFQYRFSFCERSLHLFQSQKIVFNSDKLQDKQDKTFFSEILEGSIGIGKMGKNEFVCGVIDKSP